MRRCAMRRIPWSPWSLSRALLGVNRPGRIIRPEGELAGVRKQMAGYLKEPGV
jgi:hypothetical protein